MKTIILSSFALLIAWPAVAQEPSPLRDVIAEACAASDSDLVGKRLAKECRVSLRAQAKAGQTRLEWSRNGRTVELAVKGNGELVKLADRH